MEKKWHREIRMIGPSERRESKKGGRCNGAQELPVTAPRLYAVATAVRPTLRGKAKRPRPRETGVMAGLEFPPREVRRAVRQRAREDP